MSNTGKRNRKPMYSLLLAIIYLAFISLGLPDSLLGAGWPTIHAEMGVPISYMGMVTMLISASTIASSLLCDRVVARLGTYRITTISIGLTSLAMLGFSQAEEFWQLCLLAIPYGLGAGAIDAQLTKKREPPKAILFVGHLGLEIFSGKPSTTRVS